MRAELERTVLARAVAGLLMSYRDEHDLTQRALAELLGMTQPQVARLERGEVNPGIETLMRLCGALGIELTIDVRPAGTRSRLVTRSAQAEKALRQVTTDRVEVLVAATETARTGAARRPPRIRSGAPAG